MGWSGLPATGRSGEGQVRPPPQRLRESRSESYAAGSSGGTGGPGFAAHPPGHSGIRGLTSAGPAASRRAEGEPSGRPAEPNGGRGGQRVRAAAPRLQATVRGVTH